jgi:energy-coupling factor transport system permease protein
VYYTLILTYTTSSTEITYGLEKVFSPFKYMRIPVNKIALSISLALRFIPTIFEQSEKILKSQASRGIDFYHSGIREKVIAVSSMLFPMFILSFKRADNLADAMEVRLYDCNSKRTNYRMNKWTSLDDMMIVLHVGILIFFIIRRF